MLCAVLWDPKTTDDLYRYLVLFVRLPVVCRLVGRVVRGGAKICLHCAIVVQYPNVRSTNARLGSEKNRRHHYRYRYSTNYCTCTVPVVYRFVPHTGTDTVLYWHRTGVYCCASAPTMNLRESSPGGNCPKRSEESISHHRSQPLLNFSKVLYTDPPSTHVHGHPTDLHPSIYLYPHPSSFRNILPIRRKIKVPHASFEAFQWT